MPFIKETDDGRRRPRSAEGTLASAHPRPDHATDAGASVPIVRERVAPGRQEAVEKAGLLTFHDVRMDLVTHRVFRDGREIQLPPNELRLLRHFLEHPGHVLSRRRLLDEVWGAEPVDPRTVDANVRRLRGALNEGGGPDLLRTVRAKGYALDYRPLSLAILVPAKPPGVPAREGSDGPVATGEASFLAAPDALLPDATWATIEPLLPPRVSRGLGRPGLTDRAALTGILFVLLAGVGWEMLPKEMGCGSGVTCRKRLRQWRRSGVWPRIEAVLRERWGGLIEASEARTIVARETVSRRRR